MFSLRTTVITGAGSGMGRSMAQIFHERGDCVALIGRNAEKLHRVVEGLSEPDRALVVPLDVSKPGEVTSGVQRILDWSGGIDVLLNNAGIMDSYLPAHQMSFEEWRSVLGTNLDGAFLMAKAVIPAMLERGAGVIINVASTSAHSAAGGGTAYTASKHGLLGLTRQLTFEYGRQGIRVNAISPGATESDLTQALTEGEALPDLLAEIDRTPARRFAHPDEIAKLAWYLASADADFIHGESVGIDGGWITASRNAF